jgi:alginate O-acetyltransferase complex protein AlgI
MLFTEPTFLFVFLPVLLALYFLPGSLRYRNWLLVIASVVFYARGAGSFTTLILGSIVFNYMAALWIDRLRGTPSARWLLWFAVALNLSVLGVFKYAGFFTVNLNAMRGAAGLSTLPLPAIVLPIGISFFTFHAISYVVDVYRRDAAAQKRPVEAALYLLLFPQLIAGPIIRYREIAAQLTARVNTVPDFAYGIRRFTVGLAKKMLVANIVAVPADKIFAMAPAELTAAHAWLAVVCYTLQIYFDFSGYSDMAIGLGRMFGFRFPENFRYPYVAMSMQDFWRRWHMTLSRWLRDYVYIPLGGNRRGNVATYRNLMLTMLIGGLWHGAAWTFVVWGGLHGAALAGERWWRERRGAPARRATGWPLWRARILTFHFVCLAWIFFRSDSFASAWAMIEGLFTQWGRPSPLVTSGVLLALAVGIGSQYLPARVPRILMARFSRLPVLAQATVLALALMLTSVLGPEGVAPFIYFQF